MNYTKFVSEPSFFSFLLEIDRSTAIEAQKKSCAHCGGKLDRANFTRSGLGLPGTGDEEFLVRFSLCCRNDGCRKRLTPESVRFLRGVSYAALIIVLLAALNNGPDAADGKKLAAMLKVSRQTVQRWIRWWRDHVISSPFWRVRRGNFMPSLLEENLPHSLIEYYKGMIVDGRDALVALLIFLGPLRLR